VSGTARFLWICAASAGLCFVGLVVWSTAMLQPGGLLIFDSRLWGYTPQDARDYLAALDGMARGYSSYLGTFHQLDTVFPVLLTMSMTGALWLCSPWLPLVVRVVLLGVPLGYLWADLMENAAVAQMIRTGVQVKDAAVLGASGLTVLKWRLLALSVVILVLLWRWSARKAAI